MGGKAVQGANELQLDPQKWTLLEANRFRRVLENKLSGNLIEEYLNSFTDPEKFKQAIDLYNKRLATQADQNVHLIGYRLSQKVSPCATILSLLVYVQRIPKRLSDVTFSLQKGVHILHQVMLGFHKISQVNKLNFQVTPDMIGINCYDQIKVWFNEDFSKVEPSNQIFDRQEDTEHDFIKSLMQVVGSRVKVQEKSRFQFDFPKPYSFRQTIRLIEKKDRIKMEVQKAYISLPAKPSRETFSTDLQQQSSQSHDPYLTSPDREQLLLRNVFQSDQLQKTTDFSQTNFRQQKESKLMSNMLTPLKIKVVDSEQITQQSPLVYDTFIPSFKVNYPPLQQQKSNYFIQGRYVDQKPISLTVIKQGHANNLINNQIQPQKLVSQAAFPKQMRDIIPESSRVQRPVQRHVQMLGSHPTCQQSLGHFQSSSQTHHFSEQHFTKSRLFLQASRFQLVDKGAGQGQTLTRNPSASRLTEKSFRTNRQKLLQTSYVDPNLRFQHNLNITVNAQ